MANKISRVIMFLLPFLFTLLRCSSAAAATIAVSGNHDGHAHLIQCLVEHAKPSHPIASAIFTPENNSFPSVLNAYVRNLRFNTSTTRKPYLIVTALHESHVQAAVLCAQKQNLQMKIRSGGHDYEGVSYVAEVPFFILDLFNLRSIDIDMKTETAWVQVGAQLGEVYYRINKKSKTHAFPAGVCPTVGVGGHLSGGGYGNMMRKYGLTVDNVLDATIVDVKGRILDRKSMGEDLFWAIRGGGGASFGVVLSYKINLVRVPETVTVFSVFRTLKQNATELAYKWQLVAPVIDNDLFMRLIVQAVNTTERGEKTITARFLALFLGDSKRLLSVMSESFPELGLKQSDCIETTWLKSVLFYDDISLNNSVELLLDRQPQSVTFLKRKSDYLTQPIPMEAWPGIWTKLIELDAVVLTFNPYGGRMAEVASTATPFPHRAGRLSKIQYAANWNDPRDTERIIDQTRKLYSYMTPYVSKNPREAFFNYQDLDLGTIHNGSYTEGRVYGIKYFNENFDRLVKIKSEVDPGNFFRNEQSIPLPY